MPQHSPCRRALAIAKIGVPMKRAETLHHLAKAKRRGQLRARRGADLLWPRGAHRIFRGLAPGPSSTWRYAARRPGRYPATDIALINALGRKGERLEHLKPWRGYAAIRLWRRSTKKGASAHDQHHFDSRLASSLLVSNGKALNQSGLGRAKTPAAGTPPHHDDEILDEARRELDTVFAGKLTGFTAQVDPQGTEFQRKCWAALQKIPYGKTRCYGEQAVAIGNPRRCARWA